MFDVTTGQTKRGLSKAQYAQLLRGVGRNRVMQANGHSHLSQQDVRAHLTRIFGFEGWSNEILDLRCIRDEEIEVNRSGQTKKVPAVSYLCRMRLTIFDLEGNIVKVCEDAATGTSPNLPSYGDAHDFAVKNAVSYALKRCAVSLGDQFGLSLYNKGQIKPLVIASLADPATRFQGNAPADVQSDVPDQVDLGEELPEHGNSGYSDDRNDSEAQPAEPWKEFAQLTYHAGAEYLYSDAGGWNHSGVEAMAKATLALSPSTPVSDALYMSASAKLRRQAEGK